MNRRSEPRLKVYSRAVVILIDNPEREYVCSLTDISAAGFKLLSSESLQAGATAVVEVEDHFWILAEIRHSEERGDKFAIGIQRLHTLAKRGLAEDGTKFEKIQALINDFQRQGALEQELKELFDEEQVLPQAAGVAVAVEPRGLSIPVLRPPAAVPALPKLAMPSPARFAAAHPVLLHQAIPLQPQAVAPEAEDLPEEVVAAPLPVELPDEIPPDLFDWAEKHREQNTRRLLSEQKKLIRSRQMLLAIVAGMAIIALEGLLLVVLVPRGHRHQSHRTSVVDSAPPDARLER